ncbi:MAG TPA: tetratricopeptide repeat protein [Candidatus Limnocylindrales bacterium]
MPPDPGQAHTVDNLVERLRLLKVWAGDPSYERITNRINTAGRAAGRPPGELARKSTVVDCFRPGRRRLNTDLVLEVVHALHPDVGYVAQWRQALRVIGGEVQAASQVRVQDSLPQDLPEFTGRTPELDRLRRALPHTQRVGGPVVISAIEGMAGVGKTQLAIRAAHMLLREKAFNRVLFVNLRGFDPDPAQPPADPSAVLDGFLRLLGVPGQEIPHDLPARAAAYRDRLAGTGTLVVLDNAADAEQVRPLLPATPGCLTLVTSRCHLNGLHPATHLAVDVFTADEALAFLDRAVPGIPVGADPNAAARIAQRCGYLPLALGLVAGHIHATPGWTMTDHADRLDERHHRGRLDSGIELALDLSYQHVPADQQRLLRLTALHPGQDLDAYAAAALTGTDPATARHHLDRLGRDHLLQPAIPGRFVFHDLVRAYGISRAGDEDPPPQRRAALARLFDFYASASAAAVEVAYPDERLRRPMVPATGASVPDLTDQNRAGQWLDTELANLLAAAQHAAKHGWPEHTWQLSVILDRHLRTRGRYRDAATLHELTLDFACRVGNRTAEMNALNGLGYVDRMLGRYEQAAGHYGRALPIAQDVGDHGSELQALTGLGYVNLMLCRYEGADEHYKGALRIARDIRDRSGELYALHGCGSVCLMRGRYEQAGVRFEQVLLIAREIGDRNGELQALISLGNVDRMLGGGRTSDHYERALQIAQEIGDRSGEGYALTGLGSVHRVWGRYEQAGDHYERALRIAQDIGDRNGELRALAGLGRLFRSLGDQKRAVDCCQRVLDLARKLRNSYWMFEAVQEQGRLYCATGDPGLALIHHEQALRYAIDIAQPAEQARAQDGLAHAHHALDNHDQAREHWRQALEILVGLGTDRTNEIQTSVPSIRAHLAGLDQGSRRAKPVSKDLRNR